MVDRPSMSVREKVIDLIKGILQKNAIHRSVEVDADLASLGLTSIDMVHLMLAIEAAFDIAIPPSGITPENFRSVVTIEAMVAKLMGSSEKRALSCA